MAIYENLTLEKGMYAQKGKSLTDVLESLDPSQNYENTLLARLDAFSRQLKRFDIKVSGSSSDCVEKFFQNANSAALFPEYVSRAVEQGIKSVDVLPNIVATVTNIDGLDYRSITGNDKKGDSEYIPTFNITTRETLTPLKRRGRLLSASYEALRFQKIDLFTVMLKQIGVYIANAQLKDAVDVLINGDGNTNAADVIPAGKNGNIDFAEMIEMLSFLFEEKHNTIIASWCGIQKILCALGQDYTLSHHDKTIPLPLGFSLISAPTINKDSFITLDNRRALEMIKYGDVCTDYEKLIDRQFECAAISSIAGFAKIFRDAAFMYEV